MLALRLDENPRDIELEEPLPAAAQPLQTRKALQSPTCPLTSIAFRFSIPASKVVGEE